MPCTRSTRSARELKAALAAAPPVHLRVQEEVGDLLFTLVNVARLSGIDPESALKSANRKFRRRFAFVEDALRERGSSPARSTIEEMETLWQEAKSREAGPHAPPSSSSRALSLAAPRAAAAQESRRRWDTLCQIRKDKFDLHPARGDARERHRHVDRDDEGRPSTTRSMKTSAAAIRGGSASTSSPTAAASASSARRSASAATCSRSAPVYDIVEGAYDLRKFVAERNPKKIGLNMSEEIGAADGLSHAAYLELGEDARDPTTRARFVSAEKLVSDFRSRRVAHRRSRRSPNAGELSRSIAERALSNEVITPGVTTLEDVAWWMQDRLLEQGLASSFDMPSVYVTGPKGIEDTSNQRIIQRGDLLIIDWGVVPPELLHRREAHGLRAQARREGGAEGPPERVRPGREASRRDPPEHQAGPARRRDARGAQPARDAKPGFEVMKEFNKPTSGPKTDVIIGCHSVGNMGHGIGPSIAWFNPLRLTYTLKPTNLLSIEFFAYTAAPEFGGAKVRIPLEDDAVVTERGIEWLYPVNNRILLVR